MKNARTTISVAKFLLIYQCNTAACEGARNTFFSAVSPGEAVCTAISMSTRNTAMHIATITEDFSAFADGKVTTREEKKRMIIITAD